MSDPLFRKINIFLKVSEETVNNFFNSHDSAPIYKRQLSQEFEQYIMNYSIGIKRYSTVTYKVNCDNLADKEYAEPLVHSIRRHFSLKKAIKEAEFRKFKRRSYWLLFISLSVVLACHAVAPLIFGEVDGVHSAFSNAFDVFSWVILWKPIERLIFYWNPFLKELSILDKLTNAELVFIENFKRLNVENAA